MSDAGKKPSTRLKRKVLRDALSRLHFTGPIALVKSASILSLINHYCNKLTRNSTNFQSKQIIERKKRIFYFL